MSKDWKNQLYFGNNLYIMRDYIPDESVDLIYLDPPFNSKASYNVLFQEKDGESSRAQITAFEDTWHWGLESEEAFHEIITQGPKRLSDLIEAMRSFLGSNDMMAYLVMMAIRLLEMHRVLKPTGSIYLHCDPTASHYLKLFMDAVFGSKQFLNEVIWYYGPKATQRSISFQRKHDVIFYYAKKSGLHAFNMPLQEYGKGSLAERDTRYKYEDEQGRYRLTTRMSSKGIKYRAKVYLREGVIMTDVWSLPVINATAKERLGYPTQKPEALLERIINASSNPGDIIFDPFCGCGTTIAVAERLDRRWVGIDITYLAVNLMKRRLADTFGSQLRPYDVIGVPTDLHGAGALAEHNRHQFEWWAVDLVGARPGQDKKKGADKGVDGYIKFLDDDSGRAKTIIVQVKSGHVKAGDIRDLIGVLDREKAAIGAFITLQESTRPMREEAVSAGFYLPSPKQHPNLKFPRLQILSIEELLNGAELKYPSQDQVTYKKAQPKSKEKRPKLF